MHRAQHEVLMDHSRPSFQSYGAQLLLKLFKFFVFVFLYSVDHHALSLSFKQFTQRCFPQLKNSVPLLTSILEKPYSFAKVLNFRANSSI
jgi:hypothetical protein